MAPFQHYANPNWWVQWNSLRALGSRGRGLCPERDTQTQKGSRACLAIREACRAPHPRPGAFLEHWDPASYAWSKRKGLESVVLISHLMPRVCPGPGEPGSEVPGVFNAHPECRITELGLKGLICARGSFYSERWGDWRCRAGDCSVDLSVLERSILWLQQGGPTGGRKVSNLGFGAVIRKSVRERWSWALREAGRGQTPKVLVTVRVWPPGRFQEGLRVTPTCLVGAFQNLK